MPVDLKKLRELEGKATARPWHRLRIGKRWLIAQGEDTGANGDPIAEVCDWRYPDGDTANANLIAAARNDLLELLDELEKLRDGCRNLCPDCAERLTVRAANKQSAW